MKRIRLVSLLAAVVFVFSVGVASATTASANGSTGSTATLQTLGAPLSTYLIASFNPPERARAIPEDKHKDDHKEKFHGSEMSSTAVVLAGLLALTAYFFFRRKSHKRV